MNWGAIAVAVAVTIFLVNKLFRAHPKLIFFPSVTGPPQFFSFQVNNELWEKYQEKKYEITWIFFRFTIQNEPNAKALITKYCLKIKDFNFKSSKIKPRTFSSVRMEEGEKTSIRNAHFPTSFNQTTGSLEIPPQTGGLEVELPFNIPFAETQLQPQSISIQLTLTHGSIWNRRKFRYRTQLRKLGSKATD